MLGRKEALGCGGAQNVRAARAVVGPTRLCTGGFRGG